jgi:Flp pilus assembly protein TadD
VFAVALNSTGRTTDAIKVLETNVKAHPYDVDSLAALVLFLEDTGDLPKALSYAHRLDELDPDQPGVHELLKQLGVPPESRRPSS